MGKGHSREQRHQERRERQRKRRQHKRRQVAEREVLTPISGGYRSGPAWQPTIRDQVQARPLPARRARPSGRRTP